MLRGHYVKDQWYSTYGLTITASSENGGYTPNGNARILDTATPETDRDLGSPNDKCPGNAGPGRGRGGEPGQPGANCVYQGNVLIIQESNTPDPDDNAYGGNLTFTFQNPATVFTMGLMDIDSGERDFVYVQKQGGQHVGPRRIYGLGDNSVQTVSVQEEGVSTLTLELENSGAVRFVCFCLEDVRQDATRTYYNVRSRRDRDGLRDRPSRTRQGSGRVSSGRSDTAGQEQTTKSSSGRIGL